MKFDSTLRLMVTRDLEAGLTPMLLGDPGIGKSSFLEAIGNDFGTKVFTIPCNQLADRADLTGGRLIKDEAHNTYSQVFFPHDTINQCNQYAIDHPRENPILFLDEANRASSDITSAVLSFITARRIGTMEFPKNVRFVVAGNDKGNVTSFDEASISRFVIYHVEPDVATYLSLDPDLNKYVVKALQKQPDALFGRNLVANNDADDDDDDAVNRAFDEFLDEEDFNQIATPRTITNLAHWLDLFSDAELLELIQADRLKDVLVAHTGETLFTNTLYDVIVTEATTGNQTPASVKVPRPMCYDGLLSAKTVSELDDVIANCDDREKSAALIYALYEKADRSVIITELANAMESLDPDSMRLLLKLVSSNNIDGENANALLSVQSALTTTLSDILSLVV